VSQENLELAMKAIQATTARPKPDFETMNKVFHPDHTFVPILGQIEGAEFQGGRGYQQFLQEQAGSDAAISWESDFKGAVDVGNRKVLAVTAARYRGATSGVEIEQRTWVVMTVRDGRILRTEIYLDPTEALNAALKE
jgi:ketosteroid isomerase-like protein